MIRIQATMKILFIHHSTGANLLRQGRVRRLLADKNPTLQLWDHNYNLILPQFHTITSRLFPHHTGLSDAEGRMTGKDYNVSFNNTNPDGFLHLFQGTKDTKSTLEQVLNYDVILFKSCYPVTKITSDEQLELYKKIYQEIVMCFDRYPTKLFIPFTPPPLRYELTKPEYAQRARAFADWLSTDREVTTRKNVRVFNFFDLLADNDIKSRYFSTLKREYCRILPFDSHPNKRANEEVGSVFVDFLVAFVETRLM